MGEFTEGVLDGLFCESCGCLIVPPECENEDGTVRTITDDDLPGYPQKCAECEEDEREEYQ